MSETELNTLAERLERAAKWAVASEFNTAIVTVDDALDAAQALRGMGDYLPEVPSQAMLDEIALAGDHAVLSGQIYPALGSKHTISGDVSPDAAPT